MWSLPAPCNTAIPAREVRQVKSYPWFYPGWEQYILTSFVLYSCKISPEFSAYLDCLENRGTDPVCLCILIISRAKNTKIYLTWGCAWKLNRAIRLFPSHGLMPQLFKFPFCTWLQILQTLSGSISLPLPLLANQSRWKMWLGAPGGCSWHSLGYRDLH